LLAAAVAGVARHHLVQVEQAGAAVQAGQLIKPLQLLLALTLSPSAVAAAGVLLETQMMEQDWLAE
jgi:hypothetical protein